MRTVKEIRCNIMSCVWESDTGLSVDTEKQDKLLKEWATEIIEESRNTIAEYCDRSTENGMLPHPISMVVMLEDIKKKI